MRSCPLVFVVAVGKVPSQVLPIARPLGMKSRPRIFDIIQPTACGQFPFRLCWQIHLRPLGIGLGIRPCDMNDGVIEFATQIGRASCRERVSDTV